MRERCDYQSCRNTNSCFWREFLKSAQETGFIEQMGEFDEILRKIENDQVKTCNESDKLQQDINRLKSSTVDDIKPLD